MKTLKLKKSIFCLCMALSLSANAQKITDHLTIPSVYYNSINYQLSGANQVNENHYKQLYLSNHENQKNFSSMIQIEVIFTSDSISHIFKYKLDELEAQKKEKQVIDYSYVVNDKSGEYTLSYLSRSQKNKNTEIVEWNAYRYKSIPSEDNSNGIMLFSITKRASKQNDTAFLNEANNNKSQWMNSLSTFGLPTIHLVK